MGLVHWDDPEGWYMEGGGRGVQDGEHVLFTFERGLVIALQARQEKKALI